MSACSTHEVNSSPVSSNIKIMHHVGGKVTLREHLKSHISPRVKVKKIFDKSLLCKDFIKEKCTKDNCKLLHKKICAYSAKCNNFDRFHRKRFFHPKFCKYEVAPGDFCKAMPGNHFLMFAHRCRWFHGTQCKLPATASSNGFLCDMHLRLITK